MPLFADILKNPNHSSTTHRTSNPNNTDFLTNSNTKSNSIDYTCTSDYSSPADYKYQHHFRHHKNSVDILNDDINPNFESNLYDQSAIIKPNSIQRIDSDHGAETCYLNTFGHSKFHVNDYEHENLQTHSCSNQNFKPNLVTPNQNLNPEFSACQDPTDNLFDDEDSSDEDEDPFDDISSEPGPEELACNQSTEKIYKHYHTEVTNFNPNSLNSNLANNHLNLNSTNSLNTITKVNNQINHISNLFNSPNNHNSKEKVEENVVSQASKKLLNLYEPTNQLNSSYFKNISHSTVNNFNSNHSLNYQNNLIKIYLILQFIIFTR